MKNSLLVLLVFSIGFVYTSESYGQQPTNSGPGIIMSLQLILRDSDDHLITYLDVQKVGYLNVKALHEFLDYESARGQDPTFITGGTEFQLIQRTITYTYDSQTVISDVTLNVAQDGRLVTLVRPIHDGISGAAGDTLTAVWTFIRPV